MIVGILIVVALGSLIAGLALDATSFVYLALGLSVAGLVTLIATRWPRKGVSNKERSEPPPNDALANTEAPEDGAEIAASTSDALEESGANSTAPTSAAEPNTHTPDAPTVEQPAGPVEEPPDTVYIVPGRKRYHLSSCPAIDEHATEELTVVEADGEGFSACTRCIPDREALLAQPARAKAL